MLPWTNTTYYSIGNSLGRILKGVRWYPVAQQQRRDCAGRDGVESGANRRQRRSTAPTQRRNGNPLRRCPRAIDPLPQRPPLPFTSPSPWDSANFGQRFHNFLRTRPRNIFTSSRYSCLSIESSINTTITLCKSLRFRKRCVIAHYVTSKYHKKKRWYTGYTSLSSVSPATCTGMIDRHDESFSFLVHAREF